jgi:hypothetical protein
MSEPWHTLTWKLRSSNAILEADYYLSPGPVALELAEGVSAAHIWIPSMRLMESGFRKHASTRRHEQARGHVVTDGHVMWHRSCYSFFIDTSGVKNR